MPPATSAQVRTLSSLYMPMVSSSKRRPKAQAPQVGGSVLDWANDHSQVVIDDEEGLVEDVHVDGFPNWLEFPTESSDFWKCGVRPLRFTKPRLSLVSQKSHSERGENRGIDNWEVECRLKVPFQSTG